VTNIAVKRIQVFVAGLILTSLLLYGCNQNHKQLSGGYYLERFDEGGTSYYVGKSGTTVEGGGVFDGTVEEIGWNENWILARVTRLSSGDTNGWYALNLKTGKINGPLQDIEIKMHPIFSQMKTVPAAVMFSNNQNGNLNK
jgi:hypothetical protein